MILLLGSALPVVPSSDTSSTENGLSDDLDFNVMIEGGAAFSSYRYKTTWNVGFIKSDTSFGDQQGVFGIRLGLEQRVDDDWFLGATLGARYLPGKNKNYELSFSDTSIYYKTYHLYTLEASLILGRYMGDNQRFYGKVGPILGKIKTSLSYWGATAQKKKYDPGLSLGLGYDFSVNERYALGGLLEYDFYKKIKGSLVLNNQEEAFYSLNPSLLNVLFVVSVKT